MDQNFKDGDHVDRIEPVIQDLISGKLKVTFKDLSQKEQTADSISVVKELLHDCHSFHRYLEDISMKNLFFQELAHLQ
jgi:hypothetical protein